MEETILNYRKICKQVLDFDNAIRFAGVAAVDGNIVAAEYRKGLTPLLTMKDAETSIMQSLIRRGIRKTLQAKLGRTIFAFTEYEKVKRATFVMYDITTA